MKEAWQDLPEGASEQTIEHLFMPPFLQALGFSRTERVSRFDTGRQGRHRYVDHALRKNTSDFEGNFCDAKVSPDLYVEVKSQAVTFHLDYQLMLKGYDKISDLPRSGRALVIVAKISEDYHVRIFDRNGKTVPTDQGSRVWPERRLRKRLDSALGERPLDTTQQKKLLDDISSSLGQHLNDNPDKYKPAYAQLEEYLLNPNSGSVQWGILVNSLHAQLFRKHGKVIFPVTPCLDCSNIENVVKQFRQRLNKPDKALTITLYNNKGGVGKTTSVINLAAALSKLNKHVLVVDFDPNQHDLSDLLKIDLLENNQLLDVLKGTVDIQEVITEFPFYASKEKKSYSFDVLPTDKSMAADTTANEQNVSNWNSQIKMPALLKALQAVKSSVYDYILIDAPPNWQFFSQQAVYAADVVLTPARHDNVASLRNAAVAVTSFLPATQSYHRKRGTAGPIALPIFFNNVKKISDTQNKVLEKAIQTLIKCANEEKNFNLEPFFYPNRKETVQHKNTLKISRISSMASIANAGFHKNPAPAAFRYDAAFQQYKKLIGDYFLWV